MLVFDRELRFVLAAGEAIRQHGYALESLEGQLCGDVMPGDRWATYEPLYVAALRGEESSIELSESLGRALAPSASTPPHVPRPSAPTSSPRQQLRVLLAEDNAINQRVARLMLEKLGQRVDTVSDGAEAAQAVSRTPYDLVLMDVQMPKMDGLQATRIIRGDPAIDRQPRIVALTANALVQDREACTNAGMDDYLSKPVRLEDLDAELSRTRSQIMEHR